MTKTERQSKVGLSICINCGRMAHGQTRTLNTLGMCSMKCGQQWDALLDKLEANVTPEIDNAVGALVDFGINWPKVSHKQFRRLAAISEQMNAQHPELWPFKIETSGDCWLYQRKDAVVEHVH